MKLVFLDRASCADFIGPSHEFVDLLDQVLRAFRPETSTNLYPLNVSNSNRTSTNTSGRWTVHMVTFQVIGDSCDSSKFHEQNSWIAKSNAKYVYFHCTNLRNYLDYNAILVDMSACRSPFPVTSRHVGHHILLQVLQQRPQRSITLLAVQLLTLKKISWIEHFTVQACYSAHL